MDTEIKNNFLTSQSAYPLANVTKTPPQFEPITPRWLTKFFEWKALETGIYRLNKVKEGESVLDVFCSQDSNYVYEGFIDYEPSPREYILNSISSTIKVDTRISDVFNNPYDQVKEQLRINIESMREKQEAQLINHEDYGLLHNITESQHIKSRTGYPTPDDLDEMISKVWKEPSFFLAHPAAIAAFGRECTRLGVPPAIVNLFGSPFMTWRGIPIVPTDKLLVDGQRKPLQKSGKTNFLLVRTGEQKQGVIGLYMSGLQGEQSRGLSVRFMGIDQKGIASYLITLYCSVAILSSDAIAVLENVDIGHYYD
ncbi:MAG: hypothetical protein N2Z65_01295, partial [Clostridiales bacterium]|nr:hypothetical protein [Clostridiales bacterium]